MSQFVIIANGPFLDISIIQEATQNHQIIALDGAANRLHTLAVTPHVILGDFDSIDPASQQYWGIEKTFFDLTDTDTAYLGNHNVMIVPAKNQDFTDLEKGIQYCDQHGATQIIILCATGGREDQHEAMKHCLKTNYSPQRPILVHSNTQTLRYAKNESIVFHGVVDDYCGFVAEDQSHCTSEGLRYACNHATHSFCNRMNATQATLHIKGSALLIMPLQLAFHSK